MPPPAEDVPFRLTEAQVLQLRAGEALATPFPIVHRLIAVAVGFKSSEVPRPNKQRHLHCLH